VHTGDKVISRDPATGKTEIKTVLNTTVHQVHDLVILHFAGKKHGREIDSVTATPVHPFYVKGKGFVTAGQLAVGNCIVTRAGPDVVIIKIEDVHLEKSVPVYNLTVSDDHTYFVGTASGGEWVHNAGPCSVPRVNVSDLPADEQEAVNVTMNHIDGGTQGPGRWNVPHGNREGNLPPAGPNGYSEYYVPPNPGQAYPGPNRIVVNNDTGDAYYSWNHYGSNGTSAPPFVQTGWQKHNLPVRQRLQLVALPVHSLSIRASD